MTTPADSLQHAEACGFVSGDFNSLATHMSACQRAQGGWHSVQGLLESVHSLAAGRIVTTAVLILACGMALASLA